jgi:thymidylate kinase
MIVELFGPPAAGKTTLAHALATALEKNGCDVQLIASSRPAEHDPIQLESTRAFARCGTTLAAPLSRAAKLVSVMPVLLPGARSDELAANLMNLLPPRNVLRSLRYRRYLSLLSRSWHMANASNRIVIFDQGFLMALCSLVLLARCADRRLIARGLELIPRPNLLIRLDVPRETLEARLRERLGRQGALERLFENDLRTSLRQIEMTGEVAHMLQDQGGRMMHVSCLDRRLLETAVDRIVREIGAKRWDGEIDYRFDSGPRLSAASSEICDRSDRYRAYSASQ